MASNILPVAEPRLQGRWRVVMRVVWLVIVGGVLLIYIIGMPSRVAHLTTITEGGKNYSLQLSEERASALQQVGISHAVYYIGILALELLVVLSSLLIGGLMFWRSDTWAAFVVSLAMICFNSTETEFMPALVRANLAVWHWPVKSLQALGAALTLVVFYVFPDGRFVPRWTRLLAIIYGMQLLLNLVFPDMPGNFVYGGTFDETPLFSSLLLLAWFGSGTYALIYRYRSISTATQRQQMKWAVYGLLIAAIAAWIRYTLSNVLRPLGVYNDPLNGVLGDTFERLGYWLALVWLTVCFGVAILRYRLWDIDVIINRTLVYSTLTAGIAGVYVLVVVSLGALFRAQGSLAISLVATGIVAVVFQPLRLRLQRGANRLLYGERDDPYAVLARLDQRLAGTIAPEAALPTLVETVATALKLPYAAVELKTSGSAFLTASVYGTPPAGPAAAPLVTLPLVYQHEAVGQLVLAPRSGEATFRPADRRLLDDLARHAGVVAHAVRLTADLQRAQVRLVTAREEERRRLRRDLHDGLGPQLASLTLTLGAARDLLAHDPAAADALLEELSAHMRTAMADIRRMIYALRPPDLDSLGLIGALRALAEQTSRSGLQVLVDAPALLPSVPAAVEVAVYRIVQEALTNIVRHAQAGTATIQLALTEVLTVTIQDDGVGIPAERSAGIGMLSMRERAAELGGICMIERGRGRGTLVRVQLPLLKEAV